MHRMGISLRRSLGNLLHHRRSIELDVDDRFWNLNGVLELGKGSYCRKYATIYSGGRFSYSPSDGSMEDHVHKQHGLKPMIPYEQDNEEVNRKPLTNEEPPEKQIGKNISSAEKRKFLVNTLLDLKDSKEAVYGTLDAWVAWEHDFPLVALKKALLVLEKEEQWHRVVQVVKWMLSKGQGTTMGTYEQLIRALEKDNRAEEAHRIWVNKISHDLHSVPWRFCDLMLSIYYRNNMLERLVKLFQGLEAFDRKPPNKSIVRKVGDAYEILGLLEEKDKLLAKYKDLFSEPSDESSRKSKKASGKKTCQVAGISENILVESGTSDPNDFAAKLAT